MRYIDVHTHLNLAAFKDDSDAVALRALDGDVAFINVGTQYSTSVRAVEMLEKYPKGVYATIGLHPIHASENFYDKDELDENERAALTGEERFDVEKYKDLAKHVRVVAVGECGFDYFHTYTDEDKKKQYEAFEAQIAFANEINKPLMLHIRNGKGGNAYREALAILKKQAKVRGNSHFFAGTLEEAKQFWDIGYSTSFTGVITFAGEYDEVVRNAPSELIHAETDAPYVSPVPHRGKRNEPLYVQEVVRKMAQIRGISEEEIVMQLKENAKTFFAIGF